MRLIIFSYYLILFSFMANAADLVLDDFLFCFDFVNRARLLHQRVYSLRCGADECRAVLPVTRQQNSPKR